ncbi:MAG: EamA family transporter [Patescibacteria group bacterium]|nr:EamA family transporter [Patescibacteria group bacterium]
MWLFYALLSAFTAALVAIFAKLGLKDLDSTLATTIRGIIMASFLVVVSLFLRKFDGFSLASLNQKEWLLITLAGISGALSWLFYFVALQKGAATGVVAIDKLSIVFVVLLATVFLSEGIGWKSFTGALLMVGGAILIAL